MPTSWNSGDESIYPWGYILTPQSGHVLRATMPAVGSGQSRPQPHPRAARTVSGIILGSRPAPPAASPAAASPRGKGVVTVRSDEIKRGVARAPHRSLLRALGISCLLYTSDAADEEDSVDLGGRRIIKKKKKKKI